MTQHFWRAELARLFEIAPTRVQAGLSIVHPVPKLPGPHTLDPH